MLSTTFTKTIAAFLAAMSVVQAAPTTSDVEPLPADIEAHKNASVYGMLANEYEAWRTSKPNHNGYWEFGPGDAWKCYDLSPKLFHQLNTFYTIQGHFTCVLRNSKCTQFCPHNCRLRTHISYDYSYNLSSIGWDTKAESYYCFQESEPWPSPGE
ncbi:hypothetical protein VTJ49DRAFT_3400 [Mycothermus thermophilus]|uniref:Uncharacterized protein n=1 Tax=Humicola insolens TaxID=85995 RepID=A0ABR3V825_HUMIN